MKTRRTRIAILVASLTLLSPPVALAAVLGEVSSLSAIGSPLRVEINVPAGNLATAGNCLRIVTPADSGHGLPAIRRARISASGSGSAARIVISSSEPMFEPAARLTIENVCESRLRRDYTLLFPYPAAPQLPAAASVPPPRSGATRSPRPGDRNWTTAPGESLDSLAQALYPRDAAVRRQFIRETARANPGLFPDTAAHRDALPAGTTIVIPDLARIARAATPATPRATRPARTPTAPRSPGPVSPAEPVTPVEPVAPVTRGASAPPSLQDRLIVAPDEGSGSHPGLTRSGTAGQDLDRREQEISAAIDRSIVSQMELLARIKELEQIQARLMEQANRLGAGAPTAPAAAPPLPPPAPAVAPAAPAPATGGRSDWLLIAALALAALAIAAALIIRSRRQATSAAATESRAAPGEAAVTEAPETVAPPATLNPAHVGGVAPLDWEHSLSGFDSRSLAPLAAEEEVEEHDSAIELAEIMMSFGRVHGAAETLAEFIRGNPKQAVTPWLKLLEVYRAAGLRAEFDGLARQLNKTFNVKAVTWENFDAARSAPDSLEKMPHLIAALQDQWGTRECQAYLQQLLRDNRDGTREGFPLNVIDEILCLSAVLEQLLGPYKANPEVAAAPPAAQA